MDRARLQEFRHRLEVKRQDLQARRVRNRDYDLDLPAPKSINELSLYDNHPGDVGSETFERGKDFALRENQLLALNRIAEALDKIDEGTYGYCDICGNPINSERLEAVPETTLCYECAVNEKGYDQGYDDFLRPIEETALEPPFGRTFTDGSENVAYDGEDAWQDVALYGTSESPSDLSGRADYDALYVDGGETVGAAEDVETLSRDGVVDFPGNVEDEKEALERDAEGGRLRVGKPERKTAR